MLRLVQMHCGKEEEEEKKLEVRNLMLLQYPDAADCPLRVKQLEEEWEEWLHGRGCGCVGVGKKENDHVTILIHPLGLMYAAGQRNGHSGSVQFFLGSSLQPHCSFPVIIPAWAASSVISVALFYLLWWYLRRSLLQGCCSSWWGFEACDFKKNSSSSLSVPVCDSLTPATSLH